MHQIKAIMTITRITSREITRNRIKTGKEAMIRELMIRMAAKTKEKAEKRIRMIVTEIRIITR